MHRRKDTTCTVDVIDDTFYRIITIQSISSYNGRQLTSTEEGMVHNPEIATRANVVIVVVENFILRCLLLWVKTFVDEDVKKIILCAFHLLSKKRKKEKGYRRCAHCT